MKASINPFLFAALGVVFIGELNAQNNVVTYQSHMQSGGAPFTGTGQFKFALVTSTNLNSRASAAATTSGGFVTIITVTEGGSGYVSAPAVTILGGGGSGAGATASISNGAVDSITVESPGFGYVRVPVVVIEPPPEDLLFTTHWSNDDTSVDGSEPDDAVTVPVNAGLFAVRLGDTNLPFMSAFGPDLFLQPDLELRIWFNDGVNGFSQLSPTQPLSAAPYAMGDPATIRDPSFLGTTSLRPLEFHVNNLRVARFEDNGDSVYDAGSAPDGAPNVILGAPVNSVADGVVGATISGGGATEVSTFTAPNTIGDSGDYASVGGGLFNTAGKFASAVGGGFSNTADGTTSTVGGGDDNTAGGDRSTIGGGSDNTAGAGGSTIGGGVDNVASGGNSTIAGGSSNRATGDVSSVGGGLFNTASGLAAVVPGGRNNTAAGDFSFAAGHGATANHHGSFVWADPIGSTFTSIRDHEFAIDAVNGVRIFNRGNGATLLRFDTERSWEFRQFSSGAGTALELGTVETTNPKNFIIRANALGINTTAPTHLLHVNGVARSAQSTWATSSDRRAKHNISTLEGSLERIASLRPVSFEYTPEYTARHEGYEGRFTGFIAQEVEPVFPGMVKTVHEEIGDREVDDFRLLNAGGLTPHLVAAIKELDIGRRQSKANIRNLEQKLRQKETEMTELKRRLEKLEQLFNAKLDGGQQ